MTPRRRRTSGSSGSSTRPDVDTPARDRSSGGTGPGSGTDVSTDGLDTMAGRLDATGSRVDGVGSQVGSVNVGPQSMGIVGSGFTGPAQAHVQAAQQQVSRTRQAVQNAQAGTRQTASDYRTTDDTNRQSYESIDTTTDTPRPSGDTGTTTPSGTNQPPPTTPPPPNTQPDNGNNPPPNNPPPGNGDNPPPSPPDDGGSTPSSNPPAPSNPREHWMDTVRNDFNDQDFADFQQAMDRLSEEPTGPNDLPGSSRLTDHEQDLMARAMNLVELDSDTPMQKVVPENTIRDGYLGGPPDANGVFPGGGYNDIRGFTARHQDAGVLQTPDDIYHGNRLDYPNTAYTPGMDRMHVMEYPAGDPAAYSKPIGAPFQDGIQDETTPDVVRNADRMEDAADRNGVDPNTYHRNIAAWPNSGAAVTAHPTMGVPEWEITNPRPLTDGVMIYEYDAAGNKTPVARYDGSIGKWTVP